jgi:hypothetical protein
VAHLLLGPAVRYVGETDASVWVETDSSCEVEVLGHRERTFCIEGHHYAILALRGLEPAAALEYRVALDDEHRWPDPDSGYPPSAIRTLDRQRPLKLVFGSCRVAVPHEPPWTLTRDQDPDHGREIDALYALATRMRTAPPSDWPFLLLCIGDQVYVDEDAPQTREFIRATRDTSKPPGDEVANFEEYTRLYRESWGDPTIRWLFSTISTAMIFDDHDVHDDWNTSRTWLEEMQAKPWWQERITSALMSYWLYQHLGNLSPDELDADELLKEVKAAEDGGSILRRFAAAADHSVNGSRWSYRRDLARTRIVVFDSREGRVLDDPRKIVDDAEWKRIEHHASGDFDHLLLVDTLPFLLTPALHHLEAWNECVCAGSWGRRLVRAGEWVRRSFDLEHWAAFGDSFERMSGLLVEVASGRRGPAPATVTLLGGDVHHAYMAEVTFPRDEGAKSAVNQLVCSPFRNALDSHQRAVINAAGRRGTARAMRALARTAGVPVPRLRWSLVQKPTFANQFATLELDGRSATARIEKVLPGDWRNPRIDTSLERRLA